MQLTGTELSERRIPWLEVWKTGSVATGLIDVVDFQKAARECVLPILFQHNTCGRTGVP